MRAFAPGIWIADQPHAFLGLRLGTRMTVVKLSSGDVLVHSPIRLTPSLREAIDAIGPVKHVVAPNLYHHLFVADYCGGYPDAKVHGPLGLAKKRPDVRFDAVLGGEPDPAWEADFDQVQVEGCMLRETVFLHRATSTLMGSDLVENFRGSPHWATRTYLRMGGILDKPGLSTFLRPLFRDRKAARASVDRVLRWDFQRVVIAHGAPIESDARSVVERTYAWLG
jgi:hypothetical protein